MRATFNVKSADKLPVQIISVAELAGKIFTRGFTMKTKLWPMPMKSFIILFMLLDPSLSSNPTIYKSYNQIIRLNCPGCDSNECPISINGVNTTAAAAPGYHIQNSQLIGPSRNWDGYGISCCGELNQRSCYTICPQYTEICEGCLRISVNATTIAVGDIIMVNCSINQRPHNGITLFINEVASTDPSADLRCSTENVWGHLVTYRCIAKKSGMINITANTEFCDTVVDSQQISITIEEKRIHNKTEDHHESSTVIPLATNVDANTSRIIPVTTKTVETTSTSTTMTSTAVISNGISSTIMHSSSATASGPNNREEANQSMRTVLIIVIVVILSLILLVTTVILGVIYRIKISNTKHKQHGPPALELQIDHPPVMVENDSECLELTSQQPEQCTQLHIVQDQE